ncbi:MAG: hypothetical protein HN719_11800, partial [Alphaproteobacteria bacterium]|nr:hypothetical protein [Alphaproteobacteria bacterium]
MIRVFLLYVLPILLPSVMYFCWIAFIHKGDLKAPDKQVLVREGPWFRLIFAGLGLMIIGLAITAITGGMSPDGQYQAPYAKDG